VGDVNRHRPVDGLVTWGIAEATLPDEVVSGDLHVVQPFEHGILLGVVDGLGHGLEAAAAARVAAANLRAFAHEAPITLVQRCHEELKGTRGAALTLASLDHRNRTVTWLGVGNVEAALFRACAEKDAPLERVLLRGGIVGHQLPPLRATVFPVAHGDLLLMATDGVDPQFADHLPLDGDPERIAERIMAQHRTGTDDALVMVARYLGGDGP
jgi:phosphoserine phosphatase RsbX